MCLCVCVFVWARHVHVFHNGILTVLVKNTSNIQMRIRNAFFTNILFFLPSSSFLHPFRLSGVASLFSTRSTASFVIESPLLYYRYRVYNHITPLINIQWAETASRPSPLYPFTPLPLYPFTPYPFTPSSVY